MQAMRASEMRGKFKGYKFIVIHLEFERMELPLIIPQAVHFAVTSSGFF